MKSHDCKEKKGSILEDKTLIGYFSMIERLLNMILNKFANDKLKLSDVVINSAIIDELF